MGFEIVGNGSYLPKGILTNDMLSSVMDTNDEWILSRTGINTRRIADGETTLFMGVEAGKLAIEEAKIPASAISVVIVATITNDNVLPSVASLVQRDLGLREDGIIAFDMNAACSGFLYALTTAHSLLGDGEYALVIGSERISNIIDYTDRSTSILFGDGAGAVVIKKNDNKFVYRMGSVGNDEVLLCNLPNKRNYPFWGESDTRSPYVVMDGKEVYRFAVEIGSKSIEKVLEEVKLTPDDIDCYVLHQANARIVKSVIKRLGQSEEKAYSNIDKCGNTSAASIAILIDEMRKNGKMKKGDRIIICAFGGGLTYGCAYMEY